jgi:hypothetical protein
VTVQKREGEGGLNWGQRWWMGGSHHDAAETVALERKQERRGLRWWERQGRHVGGEEGGEELELRRGREENDEKRERVVAGGFSSTVVARGSDREKRGPLRARSCGRGRRRRGGPRHSGWQRRVTSNGPRLSGTGGGAIAQQGRAVGCGRHGAGAADRWGRDESRGQCQRWGVGGRGVSKAARGQGADR